MTIQKVKEIFAELKISDHGISFSDQDILLSETTLCLWELPGEKFTVFSKDRNDYIEIGEYDSEDAACKEFLNQLKYDYPILQQYIS